MSDARPALTDDIPELVRLRAVMLDRMAADFGPPPDVDWRTPYRELLTARLGTPHFGVFVVDVPGGRLASAGTGIINPNLPSPWDLSGLKGHLLGMATDPGHRRRGHARTVLTALLQWFTTSGVTRVELNATTEGEPLYRSLGFTDPGHPPLTYRP